jgi:ABC-2 type transport system ATP-binding protein
VRRPTRSTWISRRTLPRSSDGRGYAEAVAGVSNAIAAERLTVRYGAVVALDDVSVALDAPSIGLLGANGAGKSTLMKALLGLVSPTSGSVQVLGFDAAHRGELRRRLGYMPEHDCLPPQMTARDLVVHLGELRGLPRRAAALRASEVLFQVGLDEERSRLIGTFSTGMKQRVKLAQALVHAPDLVVLDEPTNGLDPQGMREIRTLVRELAEDGTTVFLSSHLLDEIEQVCTHAAVMAQGRLIAQGTVAELAAGSRGRLSVTTPDAADAVRVLKEHGVTDIVVLNERVTGELPSTGPASASPSPSASASGGSAPPLDLADLNAALVRAGVRVRAFGAERASLEDAFVALTGEGFDVAG